MDNFISIYQHRLALQSATFSRIDHEDATVAIVYKVTQPNNTQLILKICSRPEDYRHEVYFLNHFSKSLPVPNIIQTIKPSADIDGAILMECLPGSLLKIIDFTDALAYETGALLARIHLNQVTGYGDLLQPENFNLDPRIHFSLKFEENIAECSNHLPTKLIEQCRHYYDTHLDLLRSVDGPCIIHRDFRPGNLIIDNGKLSGIIDWSAARASFAQEDFCSMEHAEWLAHPTSKKPFLAGYASIRPVPDYNAIMPLLRLNRALATIGFTLKRGTWNNNNALLYQFNREYLETLFSS